MTSRPMERRVFGKGQQFPGPPGGGGTEYFKGGGCGMPGMGGCGGKGGEDAWSEEKPGFNASAMMQMMSSVWGGKIGGGQQKGAGGCQMNKGGWINKGGGGKGLQVDDSQVLGDFMGSIKSFNPKSGYGFIDCPDLRAQGHDKDVFLHHQQLGEFEVGAQIQFTAFLNQKGSPQAKDLKDPWGGAAKKPKTEGGVALGW